MNKLGNALGKNFVKNKDAVRIRSFELGGHVFKVKVPLTAEFEIMQERMKEVKDDLVEKYYKEMTAELEKHKDKKPDDLSLEFKDNDIILDGNSMREVAKNKAIAESRITEMFKLLVPEEEGFNMDTITYEMIEELFPFPVQMQIIEKISLAVSPNYEGTKGK